MNGYRQFLLESVSVQQIYAYAKQLWSIGKRQTQLYIKKVREEWAEEASQADYLAQLWQSKLEVERLLEQMKRTLHATDDARLRATLGNTILRLINKRDDLAASILEHRYRTAHDQSPDSKKANANREGKIVMTADELFDRFTKQRYNVETEFLQKRAQERDRLRQAGVPMDLLYPGWVAPAEFIDGAGI